MEKKFLPRIKIQVLMESAEWLQKIEVTEFGAVVLALTPTLKAKSFWINQFYS